MIPTLIIVGIAVGMFIHDRTSLGRALAVLGSASILWGVAIGVTESSLAIVLGATALAFVNALVGAACSAGVRNVVSGLLGEVPHPPH